MLSLILIDEHEEQDNYGVCYKGRLMEEPRIIVSHIGNDITINYLPDAMLDWMTIKLKDELFDIIRSVFVLDYGYLVCRRNPGGQLYYKWLKRQN